MEPNEVVDRESLKAYLASLPELYRDIVARQLAARIALRSLPYAIRHFDTDIGRRNNYLTPLSYLMGTLIVHTNSSSPTPLIGNRLVQSAAEFANEAFDASRKTVLSAGDFSIRSIGLAVLASANGTDAISNCGLVVSDALEIFPDQLWESVRSDLDLPPQRLASAPLWGASVDKTEHLARWRSAKATIAQQSYWFDWTFWEIWYERLLVGQRVYAAEVAKIINDSSEERWREDPVGVNQSFDEILGLFAVEATQVAERIRLNDKNEYYAEPVTKLPKELLDEAIYRAVDAVRDFEQLMQGQQSYLGAYEAIIEQIIVWTERYGEYPMRLYEKLADAQEYIDEIARESGLMDEKAIEILKRELERSRTDLRASDPQIEERINARVRVRYDEMDQEAKVAFGTVIVEGAAGAEPGLRFEMEEDLPLIEDQSTPNDVRERALVREGERVIQINYIRPKSGDDAQSSGMRIERSADVGNKVVTTAKNAWWVVGEIAKFFL